MKRIFFVLLLVFAVSKPSLALKVGVLLEEDFPKKEFVYLLLEALEERLREEGYELKVEVYEFERGGVFDAVREAKRRGASVLMGPFLEESNRKAIKAAEAYAIPLILLTGDVDPMRSPGKPFKNIFRTGLSPRIAAKVTLRCLSKRGFKTVGLFLALDRYGKLGYKWLTVYAWEYGLKVSKVLWFGPKDTTLLHKLEELLSADAVVVWCSRGSALNVVREVQAYGLKVPLVFGPNLADELYLNSNSELSGYPFPASALLLRLKHFPEARPYFPWVGSLLDAFYLIREVLKRGSYPTVKNLEDLYDTKLPGGLYFLSSDDHYGLLEESVGLFFYDLGNFFSWCQPSIP